MESTHLDKLLLRTAFSCMACDGDIDDSEIKLIKELHKSQKTFGDVNIDEELNALLHKINSEGATFLKDYFSLLAKSQLSTSDELKLIEVAIDTIKADDKVEYSEIKFFKVIRSKLNIDNEAILDVHPDFEEYLEEDIISDSYLARLQDDFFKDQVLPQFDLIINVEDSNTEGDS